MISHEESKIHYTQQIKMLDEAFENAVLSIKEMAKGEVPAHLRRSRHKHIIYEYGRAYLRKEIVWLFCHSENPFVSFRKGCEYLQVDFDAAIEKLMPDIKKAAEHFRQVGFLAETIKREWSRDDEKRT